MLTPFLLTGTDWELRVSPGAKSQARFNAHLCQLPQMYGAFAVGQGQC